MTGHCTGKQWNGRIEKDMGPRKVAYCRGRRRTAQEPRAGHSISRTLLRAAGLPRFRVYDLRHTFASLLLSSNLPLLYVSQQLGHSKPTITLKYYARWIPSGHVHRVNVLDGINTLINTCHDFPRGGCYCAYLTC